MLVFDRAREAGGAHAERRDVIVVDASHDYREGKRQNTLEDAHVDKIVATYRTRQEIKSYSRAVSIEEVKTNSYNLNLPRYIDLAEAEQEIDLGAVEHEIELLEAELTSLRGKMRKQLQEMGFVK